MRLDIAVVRTLVAYGRPIVRGELPLDACDRVFAERRWIRACEIQRGEETFLDSAAFFARGRAEGWLPAMSSALGFELWHESEAEAFSTSLDRRPDAVAPAAYFDFFCRSTGRRPRPAPDEPSLQEAAEALGLVLEALVLLGQRTSLGGWETGFAETLAILRRGAASDWEGLPRTAAAEVRALAAAAERADVFGGMGSWNDFVLDDPLLEDERGRLSARLYEVVRIAIAVSANASGASSR